MAFQQRQGGIRPRPAAPTPQNNPPFRPRTFYSPFSNTNTETSSSVKKKTRGPPATPSTPSRETHPQPLSKLSKRLSKSTSCLSEIQTPQLSNSHSKSMNTLIFTNSTKPPQRKKSHSSRYSSHPSLAPPPLQKTLSKSTSSLAGGPPPPLMRSVSSLHFGAATSSPSKVPPCVRRQRAKKQRQYNTQVIPVVLKKVTTTFLQAYPTRTLTDDELQGLLPPDWSPTCVHDYRHFGLVRVPPSPGDLYMIHNLNLQIGGIVVKGMEKVENPYLYLQYQLKLIESEGSKEFLLFHATSYEKVLAIVKENFNWRLAGSRVGHRHGLGVYFSRSPTFCFNFAKQGRCQCFLVARVPVGAVATGFSDTRLPGPCADATGDGKNTIVKYHDHEFYPQYVIHI